MIVDVVEFSPTAELHCAICGSILFMMLDEGRENLTYTHVNHEGRQCPQSRYSFNVPVKRTVLQFNSIEGAATEGNPR